MSEQKTHWKKLTNPLYLGAYSLSPGQEIILTIAKVVREVVTGADGKKEECTIAYFKENSKPMILNATNSKTIQKMYKTPYIEDWAGRKIQIFATEIKVAGELTEALRIRPNIPKQTETVLKCADCTKDIKAFGKYTAEQLAKYTHDNYGKSLCSDCATKEKAKLDSLKPVDPLSTPQTEITLEEKPTEPTETEEEMKFH